MELGEGNGKEPRWIDEVDQGLSAGTAPSPSSNLLTPKDGKVDWIDAFYSYTEGIPTPPIFRLWSAIGLVGAAMERRVWAYTVGKIVTYPNLYILLVAPPGVGKSQAIDLGLEIVYKSRQKHEPSIHVSPDSVTKASLVDAIAAAKQTRIMVNGTGGLLEFHSLFIVASEFGVFVSAHDLDFMSVINKIYDNPRVFTETRRTAKTNIEII